MRRLLVGVVAVTLAISSVGGGSATAAAEQGNGQGQGKRYKATRAFVQDKQSGELRLPTQEEIDQVVENLSRFGQQAVETLPALSSGNGVEIELNGGFGGIVLARPAEDGTWETKCVFSLEEGAAFLGLVIDETVR
jgi:hypothetical protein